MNITKVEEFKTSKFFCKTNFNMRRKSKIYHPNQFYL